MLQKFILFTFVLFFFLFCNGPSRLSIFKEINVVLLAVINVFFGAIAFKVSCSRWKNFFGRRRYLRFIGIDLSYFLLIDRLLFPVVTKLAQKFPCSLRNPSSQFSAVHKQKVQWNFSDKSSSFFCVVLSKILTAVINK